MRIVKADIRNEKGELNRYFSECIGAGRAAEVMRYAPMNQMKRMQEECPFSYIRFHGLFHEEMNVVTYDEEGKLKFSFQYVDMLFDSLLEHNIRPIVELGLMPDILAKEQSYVFWWKMNKAMPRKIEEWYLVIEQLVQHLTARYGREEIRQWYFEVWNEPNHPGFFTENENMEAYMELYRAAAEAVKGEDEEYRVGGPASAGMVWVPEFIEYCRRHEIPVDFVSSHAYGARGDFDEDGKKVLWLRPADEAVDEIVTFGKICADAHLPLILTEWGSSFSSRDPIHDTYINAPYILRTIRRVEKYARMISYWTYTDIFEEVGPPCEPFHGGFGLFNVQSVPKPSYYVYQFLNRLGDAELVCADEDAYVCRSEEEVQILFWNFVQPVQDVDNRRYYARILPSKALEDAEAIIQGLEADTEYTIEIETVGYQMGDAYDLYLEGEKDYFATRELTEELMEKSLPKKEIMQAVTDQEGTLHFSVPQSENQVDCVRIRKYEEPEQAGER